MLFRSVGAPKEDAEPAFERATGTPAWEKPEAGKVTADVQSAKLKQLLGQIKAN